MVSSGQKLLFKKKPKIYLEAGEMAQWLSVLAALVGDPCSGTPPPQSDVLSGLLRQNPHGTYTHVDTHQFEGSMIYKTNSRPAYWGPTSK
jgi:hypothetical protein